MRISHACLHGRFRQRTNEFWSLTAVTFCTFDRFLFIWRGWRLRARWFTAVSASCSGGVTDSQLVQLERGCEPDRPMRICRCACRSLLSWANERCWYWLLTPIIKQNFNINFVALSGLKHTVIVNAWCSLASSPSSDWLKGGFLFRTVSHSSPPQTRSCAPRRRSSKLLTQRGDAFIYSIVRKKKKKYAAACLCFLERGKEVVCLCLLAECCRCRTAFSDFTVRVLPSCAASSVSTAQQNILCFIASQFCFLFHPVTVLKTLVWEARELCVELCQRYFVIPHDCRLFIGLGLVVHSKGESDVWVETWKVSSH